MNFYELPQFLAYALLVAIACALLREDARPYLRYWLAAWIIVLIHSALFMLLPARYPYDVMARGTLIVAGMLFLAASYFRLRQESEGSHLPTAILSWCGLNLALQLYATAFSDAKLQEFGNLPVYLLNAASAAAAFVAVVRSKRNRGTMIVFIVCAYAVQTALLFAYGALMASQWQLGTIYFAVAYFFISMSNRLTMGASFTALSFVLWGLVFPAYALLLEYAPAVVQQIEAGVWNLPKFLVAASMILMLLEEKIARVTHLATHDQLTGLPNRRFCDQRVEEAVLARSNFGLLIIDLDHFKSVNDTMGHQAGDELLRAVTRRFASKLRQSDTIARTGGDEFTAILAGVQTREDTDALGIKLVDALEEPVMLLGQPFTASASVGGAAFPHDGASLSELSTVADQRMYVDKARRRSMAA